MIVSDKIYSLLYFPQSFKQGLNPQQIKSKFPYIEIPYFYECFSSMESQREAFDQYAYIPKDLYLKNKSEIHAFFRRHNLTSLGEVCGSNILKFLGEFTTSLPEVVDSQTYRVKYGQLKNFHVIPVESDSTSVLCSVEVLGKEKQFRFNKDQLEAISPIKFGSPFKSVLNSCTGKKMKALIIDGDNALYRSVFGFNNVYCKKNNKFVGGSLGFYFLLFKLKEMFVEYDFCVVS